MELSSQNANRLPLLQLQMHCALVHHMGLRAHARAHTLATRTHLSSQKYIRDYEHMLWISVLMSLCLSVERDRELV